MHVRLGQRSSIEGRKFADFFVHDLFWLGKDPPPKASKTYVEGPGRKADRHRKQTRFSSAESARSGSDKPPVVGAGEADNRHTIWHQGGAGERVRTPGRKPQHPEATDVKVVRNLQDVV